MGEWSRSSDASSNVPPITFLSVRKAHILWTIYCTSTESLLEHAGDSALNAKHLLASLVQDWQRSNSSGANAASEASMLILALTDALHLVDDSHLADILNFILDIIAEIPQKFGSTQLASSDTLVIVLDRLMSLVASIAGDAHGVSHQLANKVAQQILALASSTPSEGHAVNVFGKCNKFLEQVHT